jgi:hypothetical protein
LFDSFDGLFFGGRYDGALIGSAMVKGNQDRAPLPLFPFGFPSGAPVGNPSVSSGSGAGLDLLAVLALLAILSRASTLSRAPREGFRLTPSPQLATELPG